MQLSHRLFPSILATLTLLCAPALAAPLAEAEAIDAIRAELAQRAAADEFSGAVLIAKAGKPLFTSAYGHADRERGIANTVDTQFRFASMGKMFTGVAVLQLVQSGKVKLDDPLGKYLSDYPNKAVAAVTIHQLLTHTGGTGDTFGPDFYSRRSELKDLEDYVELYGKRDLLFQPGSRWEYSNYGMVLLGRVIEVVSGRSYYDHVREHIFKPAGMNATDNLPEAQRLQALAIPYTRGGPPGPPPGPARGPTPGPQQRSAEPMLPGPTAPLRSAADTLPYRGTSSGGGYSTVGDFLKFAVALTSHALLDAHHTQLLTTGKVTTPRPGRKYAYGFEDELTPAGVRRIGHGGGAPGVSGSFSVFPESQYVVVVLSNFDPPATQHVARFIADRLPLQ